jgi:hypothetical protein
LSFQSTTSKRKKSTTLLVVDYGFRYEDTATIYDKNTKLQEKGKELYEMVKSMSEDDSDSSENGFDRKDNGEGEDGQNGFDRSENGLDSKDGGEDGGENGLKDDDGEEASENDSGENGLPLPSTEKGLVGALIDIPVSGTQMEQWFLGKKKSEIVPVIRFKIAQILKDGRTGKSYVLLVREKSPRDTTNPNYYRFMDVKDFCRCLSFARLQRSRSMTQRSAPMVCGH